TLLRAHEPSSAGGRGSAVGSNDSSVGVVSNMITPIRSSIRRRFLPRRGSRGWPRSRSSGCMHETAKHWACLVVVSLSALGAGCADPPPEEPKQASSSKLEGYDDDWSGGDNLGESYEDDKGGSRYVGQPADDKSESSTVCVSSCARECSQLYP